MSDLDIKLKVLANYLQEAKRKKLAITFFFDPVSGDLKVYKRPLDKEPGLKKLISQGN